MTDLQDKYPRVHTLVRIDNCRITDNLTDILAFMTVRNEILRLPPALEHYRRIGVARFFIVDNGSTDGSKEFLLAQPDCHVFVTHNSFAEAHYGVEWWNTLLNEYGVNHWCLVVDADEWFIYPGYEKIPLAGLTAYLDRTGAQGMFSFLLDMYGSRTIEEATLAPHTSLLDACRFFDSEYIWHRRFRIPGLQVISFPEYNVIGGPRLRLLFPFMYRYHSLLRAIWRITSLMKLPLPVMLRGPPDLRKIPLVRWVPGTRYQNNHTTTPMKLSSVTGILLHFKFLQDFHDRVITEVKRKEHYGGAIEYARYLARVKENPSSSFHYAGSDQYEDSAQLVRLGLLRENQEWKRIRANADDSGRPLRDGSSRGGTDPADRTSVARL